MEMVNHDFNIVSIENFNKCVKNQDVSLLEIFPSIELKELGYMNRMCPPLPKNYQTTPKFQCSIIYNTNKTHGL